MRTCGHRYTNFGANVTTVLEAAKIHLPAGAKILTAKGAEITGNSTAGFAEALDIASQADVVIAVMGDSGAKGWTMNTCGEDDDRTQLGACNAIVMMRRHIIWLAAECWSVTALWVETDLPGVQPELLAALAANLSETSKPFAVVLIHGRPVSFVRHNLLSQLPAVLGV
eukprot:COSAG02_NODE_20903_length_811_cov_0.912921_1_plen_169_part_00